MVEISVLALVQVIKTCTKYKTLEKVGNYSPYRAEIETALLNGSITVKLD